MTHQRPAISTDLSGIPELIADGVTGRLIEPGSATALADAIEHVRCNPAAAANMARAGRRHVGAEFSLAHNACRQFDHFRQYSDQRRAG